MAVTYLGGKLMSMNCEKLVATLFVLIICSTSAVRVMGQQKTAPNTLPLRKIQYDGDMAVLLEELTEVYGVTIGLEVDPLEPRPRARFEIKDATLKDVLNAITQSAPRYQWRENGEFIEVLPVRGSNPLLDTSISNFRVSDFSKREAVNQLVNLSEVQDNMRTMRLNLQESGDASREKKGDRLSINLESVTMRQALNVIAKESGTRFWIFRRDSNSFFSIR